MKLTVVIPVGPNHEAIAARAVASVKAQTTPCEVIVVRDSEKRGPGWARNAGLARVATEFVTFLDADDWLDHRFAERCLHAFTGGAYIYTDWFEGGVVRPAPDRAWRDGSWHIVTAFIPTVWAREVGGFDETLPGAEDTDFWHKLGTRAKCGRRWAEALVHYSDQGQRGRSFRFGPYYKIVMESIQNKYRGAMAGCGCGSTVEQLAPVGSKQEGDVLAMAIWRGNRMERGLVSGRMYPRMSSPRTAWVDPRDVLASPDLWTIVPADTRDIPKPEQPTRRQGLELLANTFMAGVEIKPYQVAPEPVAIVQGKPDVRRVLDLAGY